MNKVLSFQNFRFIFKEIFTKFLESFMSVLPILVVVAVVYGFQFLLLDLNYINEVLDTWVMDFGLNRKQKEIIETEIAEQEKAKWEAPENDL